VCPLEEARIRIPDAARPPGGSDAHLTIIDQRSGWEYDLWHVSYKPQGGGRLVFGWGGKTRIDGDGRGSAGVAAGYGTAAGLLRAEELGSASINHALFLGVKCDSGHYVYPAAGHGLPAHTIGADPGYWVRSLIGPLLGAGASIDPEVMADYIRCFRDPRTIAGSCADYRAAASTDLAHDDQSFAAGQKIDCPVLTLWGTQGFVGRGYEPLRVWQQYATDARGQELPTGHFLPEEAPDLVSAALRDFLD